ncbi:hypothetical protein ACHAWO_011306 [Cyclotella atomus]|uniref:Uncharacterized protein n=1 Tax=Cyclotella atomus TaxID=382360 RepID=A0ABD3N388_9STRA
MPPHIESHSHNEWHHPRSKSTGDIKNSEVVALCGCLDSPLFRDEDDEPIRPLSRLDRRQSNPGLVSAESQELLANETSVNNTAPFVSKIESIIGPESRYYNGEPQPQPAVSRPTEAHKSTAVQAAAPQKPAVAVIKTPASAAQTQIVAQSAQVQAQPSTDATTAATKYNKSKSSRPLMLRITHSVSKKSWRLVKYIGEKGKRFMSLMVNAVDPTRGAYEA